MGRLLKVSEVASQVGVLPSTIRYYSQLGLLPIASRTQGGFHLYAQGSVDRAKEIRRLQSEERLTLDEIRERLG